MTETTSPPRRLIETFEKETGDILFVDEIQIAREILSDYSGNRMPLPIQGLLVRVEMR